MPVELRINHGAMAQLKAGLQSGLEALAEKTALLAEPRKPKESKVIITPGIGLGGRMEVELRFTGPAVYQELGTKSHDIAPKTKAVLKLKDGSFVTAVHHPGTHPEPFINPAMVAAMATAGPVIQAGVARRYR